MTATRMSTIRKIGLTLGLALSISAVATLSAPVGTRDGDRHRRIEHLVGMQAQAPLAPYVGLWSRLAGFDPSELASAVEESPCCPDISDALDDPSRDRDAFPLRSWTQAALTRGFASSPFAKRLGGDRHRGAGRSRS